MFQGDALEAALSKVAAGLPASDFSVPEVEALQVWLAITLQRKETRAERSERNKARWASGDRSVWGGERRRRDPRRGWRNHSRP